MKLSIIMPVYNEEKTIRNIIERVFSTKFDVDYELIIVNDCSTDGTKEILDGINDERVRIFHHNQNMGKGAAIRTAIEHSSGDFVIIQDADLEYSPEDINLLIRKINEGYDAVFGSRFFNGRPEDESLIHYFGNRFLTLISNISSGLKLTDMETCYKLIRREIFNSIRIEENRFGFEPEITAKLARAKARVAEVPINYKARGFSEGKKIGIKDAFRTIYCIIKYSLF